MHIIVHKGSQMGVVFDEGIPEVKADMVQSAGCTFLKVTILGNYTYAAIGKLYVNYSGAVPKVETYDVVSPDETTKQIPVKEAVKA